MNNSKSSQTDDSLLCRALTTHDRNNNVMSNDHYKVHVPHSSRRTFSDKIACKACGEQFECSRYRFNVIYSEQYYVHCAFNCEKYKQLDKIRKCDACKMIFISQLAYSTHVREHHEVAPKPDWMTDDIYKNAIKISSNRVQIRCPGCDEEFSGNEKIENGIKKVVYPELNYYTHCITSCDSYKQLHLIRQCSQCKCLFLNPVSLGNHKSNCKHHQPDHGFTTDKFYRDWLPRSVVKQQNMDRNYKSFVNCKGCDEQFPANEHFSNGHRIVYPRIDFYIHCIEQCEQFKALNTVQTCEACSCKFISSQAFIAHKRHCRR